MVTRNYDQNYGYLAAVGRMLSADLTEQLVPARRLLQDLQHPSASPPRDTTADQLYPGAAGRSFRRPIRLYTITIGCATGPFKPYNRQTRTTRQLEWYNRPGGPGFAVAAYEKDVDGYIGPIHRPGACFARANGIINGVDYGPRYAFQTVGTNCFQLEGPSSGAAGTPVNARRADLWPDQTRGPIRVSRPWNSRFSRTSISLPGFLSNFGSAAKLLAHQHQG